MRPATWPSADVFQVTHPEGAVCQAFGFGVRGHVRALKLRDMSRRRKAATCRRTPNLGHRGERLALSLSRGLCVLEMLDSTDGVVKGSRLHVAMPIYA